MNHNRPPSNRDDREFQKIFSDCPKSVDLTDDRHAELMLNTVESLLKKGYGISELQEFEKAIIKQNNTEIFILLALKIAKSKLLAASVSKPLFISVVFAVYKEHNRILNQSEHPHGEDFLLKKVMQLDWLFKNYPNINWELIIVDDGCPENSGRIAQKIIDKHDLNDRVRVLFLANAIEEDHAVVKPMTATSDSQKGGSIALGMWEANGRNRAGNHIVIYTDADLSTHLGQVMLLADPLINQGKLVAIGSRREPESVVIKKGTRNDRGKMFIYLWKRLIPNLGDIIDTQCGFKAFKSEIIPHVINNLIEKKFAFDIELLLK
ncbi:MAG: hypothetical protein HKO90_03030, partial [Flavobacteriaceae bacterium]|nr:hypothetical protein [Flavobacteriaceae bacterium]